MIINNRAETGTNIMSTTPGQGRTCLCFQEKSILINCDTIVVLLHENFERVG